MLKKAKLELMKLGHSSVLRHLLLVPVLQPFERLGCSATGIKWGPPLIVCHTRAKVDDFLERKNPRSGAGRIRADGTIRQEGEERHGRAR